MGLVKEPEELDLYVDPKPLSSADKKLISEYIRADKEKRRKRKSSKKKAIVE